jgi:hypothetical protein
MSTKVTNNYPVSDDKLKELALQNYQHNQVRKSNFPTEIITLPSQGKVYPEGNPLHDGKIEMKYMTAREEDILTSANLIRQGVVLDKLMQSLIMSPVNYNDIIIGDKNAIMIASRILGYGKDYEVEIVCPGCDKKETVTIDLTKLPEKNIPDTANMVGINEFEYTLPQSKRVITFKLLTHGEEKAIQAELDSLKKNAKRDSVDPELSTRLKYTIQSVDGNKDSDFIDNFVDTELYAMDSKALRKYIKSMSPDQKFEIPFKCSKCDHEEEALSFGLDSNFFWPES